MKQSTTDLARCDAAHAEDRRGCTGTPDAVRVVDSTGAAVNGCVWHAAVLLASLVDGRVSPGTMPGAALHVYDLAQSLPPFAWRW